MTAHIQHLPAGIKQKAVTTPSTTTCMPPPLQGVGAEAPLPGERTPFPTPKPTQFSSSPLQIKSRYHHGHPEVCSITQSTGSNSRAHHGPPGDIHMQAVSTLTSGHHF